MQLELAYNLKLNECYDILKYTELLLCNIFNYYSETFKAVLENGNITAEQCISSWHINKVIFMCA